MTASAPPTNSVAYQSAMRSPKACAKSGRASAPRSGAEDIAHAAHGVQELPVERPIDFFPETTDQHVDDIGLGVEAVFPHVRQNHRFRYDFAGVPHQILE